MYRAWAKTFVLKNLIQSKNYTWKIRFYLFRPTICQAKPELKNPIPWFFITRSDLNLTRSDRSSGLSGLGGRVHLTGGNRPGLTGYRSNRSGPVPVWAGIKPAQILNLNLNSKKWKIPKNTSRCDKSNSVKFSQKFVRLTYFSGI